MTLLQLLQDCTSFIVSLSCFIISFTYLMSLVSRIFKLASDSDSDSIWEKILPSDYREVLSESSSIPQQLLNSMPMKDLNFHRCEISIITGDGNKSLSLVKSTEKKCLMVGARELSIAWSESPQYWKWISLPESRFSQVAKLERVWWLHAIGKFDTRILSPQTTYEVFFVFKLPQRLYSFKDSPVQLLVHFEGRENKGAISTFLDPSSNAGPLLPRERGDGWKEIKMGEFFNKNGKDGSVLCHMKGVSCDHAWSGLIIEGIEVRPKVE